MRKSQAALLLALGASLLSFAPLTAVADQSNQPLFHLAEASTPQASFSDKNPNEQCGKGTCGSATPKDKGNKKNNSSAYKCFGQCSGGQVPSVGGQPQSSMTPSPTTQLPVNNP